MTLAPALLFAVLLSAHCVAQTMEGELRIQVKDPSGKPTVATVELSGRHPQFTAQAKSTPDGNARLLRIPPGVYSLRVSRQGFQPLQETIEIRSAVPHSRTVMLRLAPVATEVTVESAAPLLDPLQPSVILQNGREQLDEALGTTLGRSMIDVITTLPGWLLEANAVLHPRGSEYDTQYVVDGMPVYDNRSVAFAPPFENGEFEAVSVMTGGIPAEYGRRLGGVIALDTRRAATPGSSTDVSLLGGSFSSNSASILQQFRADRTTVSFGAMGGLTDRYLDPPSLENYTNHGNGRSFHARLDRDLSASDRFSVYLRSNRTNFLVPNDLEQQEEGQRQDRRSSETAGQIHYQRSLSPQNLLSVKGMVRDLSARLWSNPLATPVHVDQDRGFREGAVIASLTREAEHHTFKIGGDYRSNHIRERFQLAEPDEYPELDLDFSERRRSTDASVFAQDHFRYGAFSAHVGLRLDHYRLLVKETALSPRAAVSYFIPQANLQLRASYDRIFQPPPIENLLFSSAAAGLGIDDVEDALPVPASRGNFYEIGFRKTIGNALRLDASHYWRTIRNYQDDDVFFNTGLSFPITFDSARITGTEVRLEMPRWKRVSSFLSYSNMHGTANSPVTGGLFIEGGEAEELRDVMQNFAITQDQRNTVAAQVRVEPHRRVWLSLGARYGSGLPVELEDDDDEDDDDEEEHEQPISPEILNKVDFARGRVRPNFSLNISGGVRLWQRDARSATLQWDARNLTDRLNVINFSGVFSGTSLAPGRQLSMQLRLRF